MPLDQVDVDKLGEEKEMSFLEHLEELRWHIIRSIIAIIIFASVLFLVHKWFFDSVIMAPTMDGFLSYRALCSLSNAIGMGDSFCITPPPFEVIAVGFGEAFITAIKVSIFGGFIIAFPYVLYEAWKFIKPGLYVKEQKAARGFVFVCSTLFLIGVLFGYFVIAPFAVKFLSGFNLPGVINKPTLASYISYLVMFTLPSGLTFELPVVVYFLAKVGLVTAEGMKKYRRHAIVVILIGASIITPPDVVTQFLIGVPLYFLYEVSIIIARRIQKKSESLALQETSKA